MAHVWHILNILYGSLCTEINLLHLGSDICFHMPLPVGVLRCTVPTGTFLHLNLIKMSFCMRNSRYRVLVNAIFVCLFLLLVFSCIPEKCVLIIVFSGRWHREICCRQEIERKNWQDAPIPDLRLRRSLEARGSCVIWELSCRYSMSS